MEQIDQFDLTITDKLSAVFNHDYPGKFGEFSKILRRTGAILSGGYILSAILPHVVTAESENGSPKWYNNNLDLSKIPEENIGVNLWVSDLDVYVTLENAPTLIRLMSEFMSNHYDKSTVFTFQSNHLSPAYDKSFMVKNNILGRVSGSYILDGVYLHIYDIMIVSNDVDVQSVPKNYDLSFCEVWYDGRYISTTHMEDIINMKGILQNAYVNSYVEGNDFIHNRMSKYNSRHFDISIPPININHNIIYNSRIKTLFDTSMIKNSAEWQWKFESEDKHNQEYWLVKKLIPLIANKIIYLLSRTGDFDARSHDVPSIEIYLIYMMNEEFTLNRLLYVLNTIFVQSESAIINYLRQEACVFSVFGPNKFKKYISDILVYDVDKYCADPYINEDITVQKLFKYNIFRFYGYSHIPFRRLYKSKPDLLEILHMDALPSICFDGSDPSNHMEADKDNIIFVLDNVSLCYTLADLSTEIDFSRNEDYINLGDFTKYDSMTSINITITRKQAHTIVNYVLQGRKYFRLEKVNSLFNTYYNVKLLTGSK